MFGTVMLPATNFKRLLRFEPPSAEYARGSSAPSAPESRLSIQDRELLLEGVQAKGMKSPSWQGYVLPLAFVPLTVKAGSYVQAIRPLPFRRNTVKIPEYLAESDANTEQLERDFSYVLLQMNQKAFHERAQKKICGSQVQDWTCCSHTVAGHLRIVGRSLPAQP